MDVQKNILNVVDRQEVPNRGKCALLWTGGKDSALALYESQLAGYDVVKLITFAPVGGKFLAHPLGFMAYQAEALGLPHTVIEIKEPFKKSYEDAIRALKEKENIEVLITGDIAEVDGLPNWIRECSQAASMDVSTPLWNLDRTTIANRLVSSGFEVIFSCVKKPWFTVDWVGKPLNADTFERLQKMHCETGLDLCGEQGEYHTLVLEGPPFKKRIQVMSYSAIQQDSLMTIDIRGVELCDKP
jgi:uncharacterized protein (TIGR00290 family)